MIDPRFRDLVFEARRFVGVSIRTRSTPDNTSAITFWRGVASGFRSRSFR
jgi:hypothetical protein